MAFFKNPFSPAKMTQASQPPIPSDPSAPDQDAAPPPSAEELQAAAAANEADALAQLENLQAELAALQAQNAELADQALRAAAEAQNARRRADEEIAKIRKFAIEGFAESMLAIIDSLEAGLKTGSTASAEQLREGAEATLRQLLTALERHKVAEVNPPAGSPFDPAFHQAISMAPAAGQAAGTVVSVLQKGYTLADRVLRPALVTVAQ